MIQVSCAEGKRGCPIREKQKNSLFQLRQPRPAAGGSAQIRRKGHFPEKAKKALFFTGPVRANSAETCSQPAQIRLISLANPAEM